MLFFPEVLTEFVNLYREGDALVKKFIFHHNFFQLEIGNWKLEICDLSFRLVFSVISPRYIILHHPCSAHPVHISCDASCMLGIFLFTQTIS